MNNIVPGLSLLRDYRREWLSSDIIAGLSVAAVALPIGIAYAQLAGFPPVIGIYSAILPLFAYALFGSSRQLIVNPDAAACAIVASTVAPMAAGNPERYLDLAIVLTVITGIFLIVGGIARLGVIANFLSRPILTGYLNGIALSIIVGQLGKLLGFDVPSAGFFRTLAEVALRIGETHVTTAVVGISLFVLLLALKKFLKRVPGPLVAAIVGIAFIVILGPTANGVAIVGMVPAGLPVPRVPSIEFADLSPLVVGAGGIMLVSFCSMMTTARGFAAKNGYSIDVNRDMSALGACDIASGIGSGFVVSGADSRTAVADSSGGKTQLTGIFAAVVMIAALLFLTGPLAYLPITALAAILISSALGLFDFASLRRYYKLSKPEFRHCVIAMLGVMTIGVLPGVIVAVVMALLNLVRHASHPDDEVLGLIKSDGSAYADSLSHGAEAVPGLIIFRFNASIVFFNADRFKDRVRKLIAESKTKPEMFLFDAGPSTLLDVTGADAIASIRRELAEGAIVFAIARPPEEFHAMLEQTGLIDQIGRENIFPTVHSGALAFVASNT